MEIGIYRTVSYLFLTEIGPENEFPMRSQRITFENDQGVKLAARLELPVDQHPHNCAIFAHCFTCNKNLNAVRNISRALTLAGIAVLRFDFTGLGDSEGEFEETNFSSNVEDLVAAAKFLEDHYEAPSLLIGHSLGGAAVIFAAAMIESVRAVATIGAPSDPTHVAHLVQSGKDQIEREGKAQVFIGGRPFTIKKQFLDDLQHKNMPGILSDLKKALLVMHSPQDQIVGIKNAGKIYDSAWHPKSFVSLDGADHLLSRQEDSQYAGEVIATWAKRYLEIPKAVALDTPHQGVVRLEGKEGYTTEIRVGNHGLIADEPLEVGGNDFGPNPYDLVVAGLGACTVMTLQMYARRKGWDLQEVTCHLNHGKIYAEDCAACESPKTGKIDRFERIIYLSGNLDEKQRDRLLDIANKCPVHKTLHSQVEVITRLG